MTPQDESATPTTTETSDPPKRHFRRWIAGFLFMLLTAGALLFGFRLQAVRTQEAAETWRQAVSRLQTSLQNEQQTLAALRQQQTETAEALHKVQQLTVTPNAAIRSTYAALSTLDDLLDELPSLTSPPPIATSLAVSPSTEPLSHWQHLLQILKQVGSQLVTIHHGKDAPDILTPAATQLVILRLHGEVAVAKWAILHQSSGIYHIALANVRHSLQRYFPKTATEDLMNQLTGLDNASPLSDSPTDTVDSN